MAARGALWNASIFSPKGKLPWEDVKREYLRKVVYISRIFQQLFVSNHLNIIMTKPLKSFLSIFDLFPNGSGSNI